MSGRLKGVEVLSPGCSCACERAGRSGGMPPLQVLSSPGAKALLYLNIVDMLHLLLKWNAMNTIGIFFEG